jgi:hypothetical protein
LGQIRHYDKTHHPLQPLKQDQAIRINLPNATKSTLGTCTRILDKRSYEAEVCDRKYRQLRASQESPTTSKVAGVDLEQVNGEPENRPIQGDPNLEHEPLIYNAPPADTIETLPRLSAPTKYTPAGHKDYVMK